MNTLPLTRHSLNLDLRIKRTLISTIAVLVIGVTLAIVVLSTSSGPGAATPIADGGQTLMHFYGTGAPPSTRPARPHTPSGQGPSQQFYGLQP
jgi:hypothetical protein